jgi:hypothetical protein
MTAPHEELEDALLRFVAAGKGDTRFYYLPEEVRKNLPDVAAAPSRYQIMEVVWALVARRLIYIDYSQPASSNWSIHATARGRAAAADSSLSPDNAPAYLKRVIQDVPELSDVPRFYLEEALEAYAGECFTASPGFSRSQQSLMFRSSPSFRSVWQRAKVISRVNCSRTLI